MPPFWFKRRRQKSSKKIKKLRGSPYMNVPRWLYERKKRVKTNPLKRSETTTTKEKKIHVPSLQKVIKTYAIRINQLIDEINRIPTIERRIDTLEKRHKRDHNILEKYIAKVETLSKTTDAALLVTKSTMGHTHSVTTAPGVSGPGYKKGGKVRTKPVVETSNEKQKYNYPLYYVKYNTRLTSQQLNQKKSEHNLISIKHATKRTDIIPSAANVVIVEGYNIDNIKQDSNVVLVEEIIIGDLEQINDTLFNCDNVPGTYLDSLGKCQTSEEGLGFPQEPGELYYTQFEEAITEFGVGNYNPLIGQYEYAWINGIGPEQEIETIELTDVQNPNNPDCTGGLFYQYMCPDGGQVPTGDCCHGDCQTYDDPSWPDAWGQGSCQQTCTYICDNVYDAQFGGYTCNEDGTCDCNCWIFGDAPVGDSLFESHDDVTKVTTHQNHVLTGNETSNNYLYAVHGLAVSSVMVANTNNNHGMAGTCPNCDLYFVNTYGDNNIIYYPEMLEILVEQGVKVVNISLGKYSYSSMEEQAFEDAYEQGLVAVASAGNDGNNNDVTPHYPSGYNTVVGVAGDYMYHQSQGPFNTPGTNYGTTTIDVSAPGRSILTAGISGYSGLDTAYWDPDGNLIQCGGVSQPGTCDEHHHGYSESTGTSFAAPMVVGLMGLLLSHNPALTNQDLVDIITSTNNIPSSSNVGTIPGVINFHEALSYMYENYVEQDIVTNGKPLGWIPPQECPIHIDCPPGQVWVDWPDCQCQDAFEVTWNGVGCMSIMGSECINPNETFSYIWPSGFSAQLALTITGMENDNNQTFVPVSGYRAIIENPSVIPVNLTSTSFNVADQNLMNEIGFNPVEVSTYDFEPTGNNTYIELERNNEEAFSTRILLIPKLDYHSDPNTIIQTYAIATLSGPPNPGRDNSGGGRKKSIEELKVIDKVLG